MRIFAISDLHVDHAENADWVANLSLADHREDVLILAGDVSDRLPLLEWCLDALAQRFRKVMFVPGNHDVWVVRDDPGKDSLQKSDEVRAVAERNGASVQPYHGHGVSILPLLGWYDYSFGPASEELRSRWMDYRACRWPRGFDENSVASHFDAGNAGLDAPEGSMVITFSHFLPRIDLMPSYISASNRMLYPVLGSGRIERQLRRLGSRMHVYGHSHVNRNVRRDGVEYVNNAFGYPSERLITAKRLVCIHEV